MAIRTENVSESAGKDPNAASSKAQKHVRLKIPRGQLLINGQWCESESGETMPNFDPTTEAETTQVAKGTPRDADAAVHAAFNALEKGPWGRWHHEERAKLLFKIADLLDARAEEFAMREAMDMGMPFHDFVATIMPHCSGLFRFFCGLAMHMNGGYRQSFEPNLKILTRREPLGVVSAITPFNFPMALSASKIAPALAAGNTIVHKPASDTPLSALAL
ncbi:MAG TPA: aldehyde dehydrogenase family protein, partial [Vicinamibacterales bacterium]|nr:aldehyde dehydrogenase family protein [Vicinamibacterales bacterium]